MFSPQPDPGALPANILHAGNVISVYSPKGGTGSTTVAVNLAVALQKEETPVVLVDGNMEFGDVTVFLNQQAKNSIIDLAPRAGELDLDIIDEVTMLHADSGIKVLAAPSRPEFAESVSGEQFGMVLDFLRNLFAYVIVDCASSLSEVTLSTIDTSDAIILVTTQEIPAIKDSRLFLDLLQPLNINRERLLFVMNKYDKRIGIKPEKVGENFKHEVKVVIPFEEKIVLPSINRGKPFMLDEKSKSITRSFISLTKAVRELFTNHEEKIAVEIPDKVRIGG